MWMDICMVAILVLGFAALIGFMHWCAGVIHH